MSSTDDTTLRLTDTSAAGAPTSLPVAIVGNGADDGANSGVPPTPASD